MVKDSIVAGARLQVFRMYRSGTSWSFWIDGHPGPKGGLAWNAALAVVGVKPAGELQSHPLSLYVKAHLINHKIEAIREEGAGWVWDFGDGRRMTVAPGPDGWEFTIEVPERKSFRQKVSLGAGLLKSAEDAGADENDIATGAQAHSGAGVKSATIPLVENPADRKHKKLVANIEADIARSVQWLADWAPICARLEGDALAWDSADAWPVEERALIESAVAAGEVPTFGASHRRRALETIFEKRRHTERRLAGARRRLATVVSKPPKAVVTPSRTAHNPSHDGTTEGAAATERRPHRKPGLWVELDGGIWARLGRSASENDELFRQAADRDLWFHVRGGEGAHVWIPRGQPGLGPRVEPSEELVRLGCQVALINSKSARSGWAVVDFTERRNLKKLRGAPGLVKILRSETRSTKLDEAFERKLMKKS